MIGRVGAGKRNERGVVKPNLLAAKILADNGYKVLMHGCYVCRAGERTQKAICKMSVCNVLTTPEHAKSILSKMALLTAVGQFLLLKRKPWSRLRHRYGLRTPDQYGGSSTEPCGGQEATW
ncbi:hypothetical protein OH492_19935 [Vibrio chagasii]|nr:hypothetical protein [Vibrio chagasii]